ncbi:hypothetical protein DL89DRAFT_40003 [Linderina pennispora]|uniref:AAA-ATPase-like domain-containing protein n=1 Tax=Linderina pennispora TaxID=61395 RepID=A0A1Y1W3W9_9FUNG|nr:uncharacterized protein DL89DRAFT_40003 [Linderina pennispora]ORX68015.1 hypothetical protein DL89DRAFT_40003 [Linderina pennispora]
MLREFPVGRISRYQKKNASMSSKDYELFHRNQPFVHEHFARYPVFYMDFKTVEVNSPDEAFYTIASKIIEISRPYISLLKTHLSDKRLWNDKGQFYSVDEKVSLINSTLEKYDGLYDFARPYAKMETRQFLPQLMSVLSKYPGGANSVIIIDNYDTPGYHAITKLVGYSNGIADTLMRDQILHEFSAFYNELFKNNSYLKIGVLAGVYNIPLYHKRPGRSDYKVFQPHHGVGSSSDSSNPFDAAFGLSETEAWDLICDHVERHSARSTPAFKLQFKKDLMSYIFKTVNHNTYGTKQYCFNTRSVIRFIEAIEGYEHAGPDPGLDFGPPDSAARNFRYQLAAYSRAPEIPTAN